MIDIEKSLQLLNEIVNRFPESSEEHVVIREVTEALRTAGTWETRPKLLAFLEQADRPLNEDERQHLREMGIDPDQEVDDKPDLESHVSVVESMASGYPVGSDEYEACKKSYARVEADIRNGNILERVANGYGELSEESAAVRNAALARIFLQGEEVGRKWRSYLDNFGHTLTEKDKRHLRFMRIDFE